MTLAAAAAGALCVFGLILLVTGLRRSVRPQKSTTLWKTVAEAWRGISPARRWWAIASIVAGVAAAAVSGFVLAVVLVPALAIGVPWLLGAKPNHEVEMLAALDRFVRLLSTSIGTGKSIRDAIFATRAQTPAILRPYVDRLSIRLDQRWGTREALLKFADELDSADGDAVAAALAIASTRGGLGTQATLTGLSNTIQDRLRALREVATERAKPRTVVKQVTTITLAVLVGAVLFNARFFEPYATPLGQLIAAALAAAYAGCLLILRSKATPPPAARFLKG